jgi:hypothetical protein
VRTPEGISAAELKGFTTEDVAKLLGRRNKNISAGKSRHTTVG